MVELEWYASLLISSSTADCAVTIKALYSSDQADQDPNITHKPQHTKPPTHQALPRDRPPIQRFPLILLNLVQLFPPPRSDLDRLGPPKLVCTLHQPDRSVPYVFPVHLFPRFEVIFRVGEGYEAVPCLRASGASRGVAKKGKISEKEAMCSLGDRN